MKFLFCDKLGINLSTMTNRLVWRQCLWETTWQISYFALLAVLSLVHIRTHLQLVHLQRRVVVNKRVGVLNFWGSNYQSLMFFSLQFSTYFRIDRLLQCRNPTIDCKHSKQRENQILCMNAFTPYMHSHLFKKDRWMLTRCCGPKWTLPWLTKLQFAAINLLFLRENRCTFLMLRIYATI